MSYPIAVHFSVSTDSQAVCGSDSRNSWGRKDHVSITCATCMARLAEIVAAECAADLAAGGFGLCTASVAFTASLAGALEAYRNGRTGTAAEYLNSAEMYVGRIFDGRVCNRAAWLLIGATKALGATYTGDEGWRLAE